MKKEARLISKEALLFARPSHVQRLAVWLGLDVSDMTPRAAAFLVHWRILEARGR